MEPPPHFLTFIVRLTRAEGGVWAGVVERVRSGRKQRFDGMAGLAEVIVAMAEEDGIGGGDS